MSGPLASLKILDFTTLLPGPFATMILADMGAAVLRVESPTRPDMVRLLPPYDGDFSTWHGVLNRNKCSLALDLKQPAAKEVIGRLVSPAVGYDVVVEQFRPGVMERLGIGYETLCAANPALIFCSITGYGQDGPYKERAGHDNNYLALSGVLAYSGREESGPPPLGVQLADIGGGSWGAIAGLLAAVIHRLHTGEGQRIDVSMLDMMLAWQSHLLSHYLVAGEQPRPESMALNGGRVYDYYRTQDGRYLAVGSLEPKFWQGFCQAIGRPDLFAPGLSLDAGEQQRVKVAVSAILGGRTLAEWLAIFAPLDVCVEPVLSVVEALDHPQVQARQMVVEVPRPGGGSQRQIANPLNFSRTAAVYRHSGVALGMHTREALCEAGYSESEIRALYEAGVCGKSDE